MIYQSVSNRYSILLFNLWISTVKSNQAMYWATNQATNQATNRATNWATKPSDELSYKSSFKTCKSNCESSFRTSCELKLLHSRATVIIWVLLIMKALRARGIYIYITVKKRIVISTINYCYEFQVIEHITCIKVNSVNRLVKNPKTHSSNPIFIQA